MHGDLVAAGRALLPVPPICRTAHIATLIARSQAADKYRKRLGKSHPDWGEGSLMSCARQHPQPFEPSLSNPDYAQALSSVLVELVQCLPPCTADTELQRWVEL